MPEKASAHFFQWDGALSGGRPTEGMQLPVKGCIGLGGQSVKERTDSLEHVKKLSRHSGVALGGSPWERGLRSP